MRNPNAYLKVKQLANNCYEAILTEDGNMIYKHSQMLVTLNLDTMNKFATSKVSGEFLKDFDLKLEALYMMRWLRCETEQ